MKESESRLSDLFCIMRGELSDGSFSSERLRERCAKRAELSGQVDYLETKAVSDFCRINLDVSRTVITMDRFVEHNAKLFITEAFERHNRRIDPEMIQMSFHPYFITDFWRFGPGASNGVSGTHAVQKLPSDWSTTPPAMSAVLHLRASNVYLSKFDSSRNKLHVSTVAGSRLSTVPKNEETRRTIAIEPLGNMALQLAYGRYIESVLASIGLDIRTQQPKNKRLARQGSMDGSLATLDLKSASDMISIPLVRRLMPEEHFRWMMRIRSPSTVLPNGESVDLNMMSTMGNGFTFPLMTLIFTALSYAVSLKRGGPINWIDWSKTAIFGDDIICRTEIADELVDTVQGAGFIVNTDKSYLAGPFRESCGGDYYEGRDVTPFYARSLATNSERYTVLNQCFDWCARNGKLLPRTIAHIVSTVDGPIFHVPEWLGPDQGFRTTKVPRRYSYLKPRVRRVRAKCADFLLMLAVGGYLTSGKGTDVFYIPRPKNQRYVVRRSRLPNGYLDGRDPFTRDPSASAYVEGYSFLVS